MANFYPTLKALHIAFMVTWFAGLFYLPRLFIYHAEAADEISRDRFCVMERRLYGIMTIGAVMTAVFGFLLIAVNSALLAATWFKLKLAMLVLMFVYHLRCKHWMKELARGYTTSNTRGLRWFNEIPAAFLLIVIFLAVVKPL